MELTIPLYVEESRNERGTEFTVRPLFMPRPVRRSDLVSRALNRVANDIRQALENAGRTVRHDDLAAWSFSPDVDTLNFDESLLLRHRTVHCRLMVASFEALGRRIAFSPTLPDLWFDVAAGESVRGRAKEVFTAYFKDEEKENEEFTPPREMATFARGSVTAIELPMLTKQVWDTGNESLLAALMGANKMHGGEELEKVGRRLDSLYPADLTRAILRNREVEDLQRLMEAQDRRPVLLVGPRMAGKTTLVHEYVFRRMEKLTNPFSTTANVWLLSPQRLISGMMYVGQWENRLVAILGHAKKKDHVLYFDDLPGLYHAGISAGSNLSAAQVLRPYIERRDVRVLGEITPEAFRILQERDRGFADLFHVIPVPEPTEADSRRVLINVMRQMEGLHGSRFAVSVLPAVMELQQRYVRDLSLPGKAATFLKDLAAKFKNEDVTRRHVLEEFHNRSGLSVGFLDRLSSMERGDVTAALQRELKGQEPAVDAMADVVGVAKAQLNDPGRPFGTLLFLGPTGVGKTQAAKALAAYLFGDAERLLRLDMNEFGDGYSAGRLVGTWGNPEGLLTAAIRRQPFAVILLDEIEKAHPDVFDLLLQVLGEGRLTDALGRTSDFSNAVIIMTSNLGVREAEAGFGFSRDTADAAAAYRRAAQQFFRPEFFNRIDRVVPFDRLSREETQTIAERLIAQVLNREGLRQRRCMLAIDPAAMAQLVDRGFQPEFGARALRRAIERELVHPVAARLAEIEPGTPTILQVGVEGTGVSVHVTPLKYAELSPVPPEIDDIAEHINAALDRLHEQIAELKPADRLTVGNILPEHVRYYALRDQLAKIERLMTRAETEKKTTGRAGRPSLRMKQEGIRRSLVNYRALIAAGDIHQYLGEISQTAAPAAVGGPAKWEEILRETAYLNAMAFSGSNTILLLRSMLGKTRDAAMLIRSFYISAGCEFANLPGHNAPNAETTFGDFLPVAIEHPAAAILFPLEVGVHLYIQPVSMLHPIEAIAVQLRSGEDSVAAAMRTINEQRQGNRAPNAENPHVVRQILRIYEPKQTVDLRTGLIVSSREDESHNRAMLLAQLPLPTELME